MQVNRFLHSVYKGYTCYPDHVMQVSLVCIENDANVLYAIEESHVVYSCHPGHAGLVKIIRACNP